MENILILTIKPERNATRIGIYQDVSLVFLKTIKHKAEDLSPFSKITDEFKFRSAVILKELHDADIDVVQIKAIVARGGLLKPIKSGIYEVNEKMKHDLMHSPVGIHAVNLGALIADEIAKHIPESIALIADPVVVDELSPLARYSGLPELARKSVFHALHHKSVARRHAKAMMKQYEELNLVVAHLGDGISIAAHEKGKVIDVNQSYDGEGPFTLDSAGTLPVGDLIRLCYSGKYTEEQLLTRIRDKGGVFAYIGSSSITELECALREDDTAVKTLFEAMAYQVAKYIASMLPAFTEPADAILITGHLANNKWLINQIVSRISRFSPVHIYPGEDILEAMNLNGLMALRGEADILQYK